MKDSSLVLSIISDVKWYLVLILIFFILDVIVRTISVLIKTHKESSLNKTDDTITIDDICKSFNISDIGEFSDGYHTFNSLYYQRLILFATIVNQNQDMCWKSTRHEDGELCFDGGWFIVGIDTPNGSYTYHYELKYWDLFKCRSLPTARPWDGHTDKDVDRVLSIIK